MNFKHIQGKVRFVSPIAYFSNAMAGLFFFGYIVLLVGMNIEPTASMMIAIFSIYSIIFQTFFFKIRGMHESEWVDKKWLKKEHKLTLDQLNQFSQFNYKFYTYIKFVVAVVTLFTPAHVSEEVSVFSVAFIFGSFILRRWLGKQGIIPFPAGYLKVVYRRVRGGYFEGDLATQRNGNFTMFNWKEM